MAFRKSSFCKKANCVEVAFRKSSFSRATCVEVAAIGGEVVVRDSKDPEGTALRFTNDEWTAFIAGVKADEFDL